MNNKNIDIKIKQKGMLDFEELFFTAYIKNQKVGELYLTIPYMEDPEGHDYIDEDCNRYGVTDIYVNPAHRRQGIAKQLIHYAESIIGYSLIPNTTISEDGEKFFKYMESQ